MTAEIFQKIDEMLAKGERLAVATVVETEGSAPRREGSKIIILHDGRTFGTIGGDRAEMIVKEKGLEALNEGEPCTVEMKLEEEEDGGVGMKCGGSMKVFIEILEPADKLVLIGSGKVVKAVAELAEKTGFDTVIIGPFAEEIDFPESSKVISKPIKEGIKEVEIDPQTYIAIITQHKYDENALLESLKTDAAYIGLMGSENRVRSLFEHLEKEKNIEGKTLSQVHAPIGLDIGAETPEELAVSIVGEIIMKKRNSGANGQSLKIDY